MKTQSPLLRLAAVAVVAAGYFVAARIGLAFASANTSATAFWPPTGIALAAALLLGWSALPGIGLGAFLANVLITGFTPTTFGIAIGNTLEAFVGAYLINRFANGTRVFDRTASVFKFALLAGILSPAVSATIGVTMLVSGGFANWMDYGAVWTTWWVGDAWGAFIIAPLLICWVMNPGWGHVRRRGLEIAGWFAAMIVIAFAVFHGLFPLGLRNYPVQFLVIPFLYWTGFRFEQRGAATGSFLISLVAIWGTLDHLGPFGNFPPNESLLLLHAFMSVVAITSIAVAAAVSERDQTEAELQIARHELTRLFQQQSTTLSNTQENLARQEMLSEKLLQAQSNVGDGVAVSEGARIVYANDAMAKIYGYSADEILVMPSPFEFIAPEERPGLMDLYPQRSAGETTPAHGETVITRKDGRRVHIEYATASLEVNGRRQSIAIARDISERKSGEEELARQRDLYETLLQAQSDLGDGILLTEGQRVVYANSALAKMLGYSAEELSALPAPGDILAPEERGDLRGPAHDSLGSPNGGNRPETIAHGKDGRRIDVEYAVKSIRPEDRAQQFAIIRDVTARKQAAAQIQASEEKFRSLLESAPDAMVIVDIHGVIRIVSAQTEKIFGYARDELYGQSIEMLIPERLRAPHRVHRSGYIQNPQLRAMGLGLNLVARRKDGSEFPVDISLSPLQTVEGVLIIADIRDLSERMQMEETLLKIREQAVILQNVSDGITAQDPAGRLIFANESAAHLLGFSSPQELIATPLAQVVQKFKMMDEDGEPLAPERLPGRVALQGKPAADVIIRFRVIATGEERWSLVSASPVRDANGNVQFVVNIFHDITERRRSGEKIIRLAAIVENSDDAIYGGDMEGTIQTWNPASARLFGYSSTEAIGQSIGMLFASDQRDEFSGLIERLRRGESTPAYDTIHLRKDGTPIDVSVNVSAIKDARGKMIGGSWIVRDITTRRHIEQALRESEERYRGLFQNAVAPFFYYDAETGAVQDANPAFLHLLGYSDSARNLTIYDIVAHDRASVDANLHKLISTGHMVIEGRQWRRRDGTLLDIDCSVTKLNSGNKDYVFVVARDVTESKRAEQALARERELLQTILDTIPVMITMFDPAKKLLRMNPEFERLAGYSPKNAIGSSLLEHIYPDQKLREEVRRHMESHEGGWMDMPMRTRDGRFIETSWANVRLSDQTRVGIGIDITERKREEQAQHFLTEASKVLASSLDYEETLATVARLAVPDIADWCAVDILSEDPSAALEPRSGPAQTMPLQRVAVAHVNPEKVKWAYELQKRFPPDPNAPTGTYHVLRTGKTEFVPEISAAMIEGANLEGERLKILQELKLTGVITVPMMARNKTLGVISFVSAESGRRYDARDVALAEELAGRAALAVDNAQLYRQEQITNEELEKRVAHRTRQLQDANAKLVAKIDERKRAMQALEASEEKFRLLVEGVSDYAIYTLDREGNVTTWNKGAERIKGYRENEILGKNFSRFYRAPDRKRGEPQRVLERAAAQGQFEAEGWLVRKDGSSFWANTLITALRDDQAHLKGYAKITRDITERKRLLDELEQSREQLRAFATHLQQVLEDQRTQIARQVHDEVGQLLTGLKLDLETLNEHLPKRQLALHEQASSMLSLLDAAIVSVRTLSAELRPGILDDLGLAAALEWHAQQFQKQTGIRIEFACEIGDLSLKEEISTTTFRIFQEILTNVARHAKASRIQIWLREHARHLLLQVQDNGIGIDPRLAAERKSFGIMGMRERAETLGGYVVFDRGQDGGTLVSVSIPLGSNEERHEHEIGNQIKPK